MAERSRMGGGVVSVLLAGGCIVGGGRMARADVFSLPSGQTSLQFVTVGDPGNAADTTGFGAVAYTYQIGTYDITVAQYTQMLNSVAQTDAFGLWNGSMTPGSTAGSCGIVRGGVVGSYTYSYASANANFPVNEVSWGDAARFCNWLANGQPDTGVENASTTEGGSYALNGAVSSQALNLVTRSPSATYVIPTENEWYKASYYKGGSTIAGYWLFPTQSDSPPSNVLSMTAMNSANYFNGSSFTDPMNLLTPVGSFTNSPGPYGTADMGGDVGQWDETAIAGGRGVRGAAWNDPYATMESTSRFSGHPSSDGPDIGFRVAEVPEPTSLALVSLTAIVMLFRRRNPQSAFLLRPHR